MKPGRMSKFSPGPWKVDLCQPKLIRCTDRHEGRVAYCEREADARLIASAPEMYESLLNAPRPQGDDRAWQGCRAALLARIEGRGP